MIDTKALRNKILDLAISGKLTEQLPEDGNAEDLYVQIQEEKARLMAEGEIKKEKPLPPIKCEEYPFSIPDSWIWTRFGDISFIVRGGSPRPIKQYITNDPDGINWIKIGDVEKGGKYIYSTQEKIIPAGEKRSRRVYPGDFLLTNSMSFGRPYITKVEGCIHDGWLLIRNLNGFYPDYLYYLLSSTFLYKQFCLMASGATVNNLNIDKANNSIIPLPPLAEQKRIVSAVEDAFDVIDRIEKAQESYYANQEVLKNKIIDAGIRGKLTEQLPEDGNADDLYAQIQEEKARLIAEGKIKKEKPLPPIVEEEIPFEIPESWKWIRFGNLVVNYDNKRKPITKRDRVNVYGYYDYYGATGAIDKVDDYIFDGEYLLIGEDGGNFFSPRDNAFIVSGKFWANNHVHVLQPIYMDINYLKHFLNSCNFVKMGLVYGLAAPKLNQKNLNSILVPIPPMNEQIRIVEKIEWTLNNIVK